MLQIPSKSDIRKKLTARFLARCKASGQQPDVTQGSVLANLLEEVVEELDGAYARLKEVRDSFDPTQARGDLLELRIGDMPGGSISWPGPGVARGPALRLQRDNAGAEQTMPAGVLFTRTDDPSQIYRLVEDVTWANGETKYPVVGSADPYVTVQAIRPGTKGNAPAGTITTIKDGPSYLIGVEHQQSIDTGVDRASDAEVQRLAMLHLSSLGQTQPKALEALALRFVSSTGVRIKHAFAWEHPEIHGYTELIVDDGSGTIGAGQKAGTVGGTIPDNGVRKLWCPSPLAGSINTISVDGVPTAIGNPHKWSVIEERGLIYIHDTATFAPGVVWEIANVLIYSGFIAELQAVIEQRGEDPVAFPGYRAAGCRVRVLPALAQWTNVTMAVVTKPGTDIAAVRAAVVVAVTARMRDVPPGEPCLLSDLVVAAKKVVGVLNVKILSPTDDIYPTTFRSAIRPQNISAV